MATALSSVRIPLLLRSVACHFFLFLGHYVSELGAAVAEDFIKKLSMSKWIDSVEYSDDMSVLVKCPSDYKGVFVVPNGVKRIEGCAFLECKSLKTIVIPDSVEEIGVMAFEMSSIETIKLPQKLTSLSDFLFSECEFLTSVDLAEGIKVMYDDVFAGCRALESIRLPKQLERICDWTFMDCSKLTSIELPVGLKEIGESVFYLCTSLEKITIPDTVTAIGDAAFEQCTSLKSIVIPSSIVELPSLLFIGCASLESITLPATMTKIASNAFEDCPSLKHIYIPKGTKEHFDNLLNKNFERILVESGITGTGSGVSS